MNFFQQWKHLLPSDTVHVIYEAFYEELPEKMDLIGVFENLGFKTRCWCVTPEKAMTLPDLIPKKDLVFLHLDPPGKVTLTYKMQPLRFLEVSFPYAFGFLHPYCENTIFKSLMNDLFLKKNVPHCPNIRVEHIDESNYDSLLKSLRQIKAPLFVKVDDGMDSEGLFQDCVAQTPEMALVTAKKLIHEFGPVNIQSYLPGREFTVALTPKGPLHPVERIFQKDELFSPKNGTASEKPLGVEETQLIETCKEVAWKAYQAVEGSCYGRADLRCDSENRVFALEVNTTCGFGPNSYFAISCRAANSSREKVVADIILSELNAWKSRKINSQPQEILKRSNSMNVETFRKTEMA